MSVNQLRGCFVMLLFSTLVGCESAGTQYGVSTGIAGRTSLNGFGALRSAYENAGYKSRDVRRLTDRVSRADVIVWTPQVLNPVQPKVTKWFDRWLRRSGRTLVYIVPDSGSEADYWIRAGANAPPEQRLEYRRRSARKVNERMEWTLNRNAIPTNGWFVLKPESQLSTRDKLDSEWDLVHSSQPDPNALLTEFKLEPFVRPNKNKPNTPPAAPVVFSSGPTGPASRYSTVYQTEITRTNVKFKSLLSAESGDCVVAKITSKNWGDSKIIVVAGGSLLTNFAFTNDTNVRLANEVIAECKGKSKSTTLTAGFMTSSYAPISVSDKQPGVPQASGMELLTVWPISLVTIHGAFLGFIVCMMLLPVFGRPRKVARGSMTNFGDHLDAVAALMSKAHGEQYARKRISEYMIRMHGETTGPWVLSESETKSRPQPVALNVPSIKRPVAPSDATPSPAAPSGVATKPSSESSVWDGRDVATSDQSTPPDDELKF